MPSLACQSEIYSVSHDSHHAGGCLEELTEGSSPRHPLGIHALQHSVRVLLLLFLIVQWLWLRLLVRIPRERVELVVLVRMPQDALARVHAVVGCHELPLLGSSRAKGR